MFTPIRPQMPLEERFPAPPASLVSEVRLLARSGSARFLVLGDPPELAGEILPHLPRMLLDPTWRSVHLLTEPDRGAEQVFALTAPREREQWARHAEGLRTFHFDAVTVDGADADLEWALGALDIASVAFVLGTEQTDRRAAHAGGIRWELRVARSLGQSLTWSLDPVHA